MDDLVHQLVAVDGLPLDPWTLMALLLVALFAVEAEGVSAGDVGDGVFEGLATVVAEGVLLNFGELLADILFEFVGSFLKLLQLG